MYTKQIIFSAIIALASYNVTAQDWVTSMSISIGHPNGHVTIETTNEPRTIYTQPGVIYLSPQVVYPAYVSPIVVPCYNCGSYPRGDPRDPYRNHHHLQRYPYYYHH